MHLGAAAGDTETGPRAPAPGTDQLGHAGRQAAGIDVAAALHQGVDVAAALVGDVRDDDARAAGHAVQVDVARPVRAADAGAPRERADAGRPGGDDRGHDVSVAATPVQDRVAVVAGVAHVDDRVDLPVCRADDVTGHVHLRGRLGEARGVRADPVVQDSDDLRRHGVRAVVDPLAVVVGVDPSAVDADIVERPGLVRLLGRPGLDRGNVLGVEGHHFQAFLDVQGLGDPGEPAEGSVVGPHQER